MKLTRERKIFASVLGLVVVAFAVDQMTGGGPSTADASDSAPAQSETAPLLMSSSTTPATADKVAAAAAASSNAMNLSARMSNCFAAANAGRDAKSPSRDLFRLPAKWSNQIQSSSADAARVAAERFARSHRLSAVSRNAAGGTLAVVEGKLLHVGASLDGFTLSEVSADAAVFTGQNGARVRLPLNAEAVR
jgi:hypothetical protein